MEASHVTGVSRAALLAAVTAGHIATTSKMAPWLVLLTDVKGWAAANPTLAVPAPPPKPDLAALVAHIVKEPTLAQWLIANPVPKQ
jgi:hypothetical protein